jgi:hypothetical protein
MYSQLNAFLNELHQIVFFDPSIVERIDVGLAGQDLAAAKRRSC